MVEKILNFNDLTAPLIYIRHSKYVGDYMYDKTQSSRQGPIIIPEYMELRSFLAAHIKPNDDMERRHKVQAGCAEKDTCSFSQEAYDLVFKSPVPPLPFGGLKLPKEKDKENLFPYLLPSAVIRSGVTIPTTACFDLSIRAVEMFRQKVNGIFWSELSSYLEGVECAYIREHKSFIRISWIERFFISRNMSLENLEACDRQYRALKSKGKFSTRPIKLKEK